MRSVWTRDRGKYLSGPRIYAQFIWDPPDPFFSLAAARASSSPESRTPSSGQSHAQAQAFAVERSITSFQLEEERARRMGTEADAAASAVDLLRSRIPFQTDGELVLPTRGVGLVLVDLCNGFCTVGAGNLAPVAPNKQIEKMVGEATRISKVFCDRNLPIFAFLDTHYPDKPEPPYPPHCIIGTGEENIVPDLEWLEKEPNVTIKRKSCIDGYISCIEKDGSSVFADWVGKYQIKTVLVLGICTDICVLDFASSTLAARNIDRVPPLQDVVIYSEGCATYDLPVEVATNIKGALAHPQDLMHHIGLYMAKGRGAKIVDRVVVEP